MLVLQKKYYNYQSTIDGLSKIVGTIELNKTFINRIIHSQIINTHDTMVSNYDLGHTKIHSKP